VGLSGESIPAVGGGFNLELCSGEDRKRMAWGGEELVPYSQGANLLYLKKFFYLDIFITLLTF
jgi:hypothetical protein